MLKVDRAHQIAGLVILIFMLVSKESKAQSEEPGRSADSIREFVIYSGGLIDQWYRGPNQDTTIFGTLPTRSDFVRYLDLTPVLDTLSINGLSLSYSDHPITVTVPGRVPFVVEANTQVLRRGKLDGSGNSAHDAYKYAIHAPQWLVDAVHNGIYLRFESERHVARVDTQEYHSFIHNKGLTGKNTIDPQATTQPWIALIEPALADTNCIALRRGRDAAGTFNNRLGVPRFYSQNGESKQRYWSHMPQFNRKLLLRFRVRLDTNKVFTGAPPEVFTVTVRDQDNRTIHTKTFYAGSDFAYRDTDFDILMTRFWPSVATTELHFTLDWPGKVDMTMDWMELMTAHIDSVDTGLTDSLFTYGEWWPVSQNLGFAYSAEDILIDSTNILRMIDTFINRYRGTVNYLWLSEEQSLGHIYTQKRVMKMIRDRSNKQIEVLTVQHDSTPVYIAGYPKIHHFYTSAVREGWLNDSLFGDPRVHMEEPYPIKGYLNPMPRRIANADSADVYRWAREMVPSHFGFDPPHNVFVPEYSRTKYRRATLYSADTLFLVAIRRAMRQQREFGMRASIALQAGAGLIYRSHNRPSTDTTRGVHFSAGLRPPTGAEFKLLGHLATSVGISMMMPYWLSNSERETITNSDPAGGMMSYYGDHSSDIFHFIDVGTYANGKPGRKTEKDVWMGWRERFDTAVTLFRVIRQYGDTLIKANWLGDFRAHNTHKTDSIPFVYNSIRSYDSLGKQDIFVHSGNDVTNHTDVHVSVWAMKEAPHDTLLYITNMRTDDSYDPGTTTPSRQDCRSISMQLKSNAFVNDILDTNYTRLVGKVRTPYVSAGDSLVVWLTPGEGVLVRLTSPFERLMRYLRFGEVQSAEQKVYVLAEKSRKTKSE